MGAILYDAMLVFALLVMATAPFVDASGEYRGGLRLFHQAVVLAVPFAFFTGYWSTRGRTLGMQSWGLQLVRADGSIPSFRESAVRYVAAILSLLPVGLGFLWQLVDADSLTWHDRLSGTRVVHIPKDSQ